VLTVVEMVLVLSFPCFKFTTFLYKMSAPNGCLRTGLAAVLEFYNVQPGTEAQ
jgi:hypothetical protein